MWNTEDKYPIGIGEYVDDKSTHVSKSEVTHTGMCKFSDYPKKMDILPNCPQSKDLCAMHDNKTCTPIASCGTLCPSESAFLGNMKYVYSEACSGNTIHKEAVFNFYKLPSGKECYTKQPPISSRDKIRSRGRTGT